MDSKLYLKPTELIDIGIDKLTKIPVPILNDNVISTYDTENGTPSDSFTLTFVGAEFVANLISYYDTVISVNFGDGSIVGLLILSGTGTQILHTYYSAFTYTITFTGWLDKIKSLTCNAGLISVSINRLKKLSILNLQGNSLIDLDINGLIYLNSINLNDNYFPNDVIDDLYIEADTFLTFSGNISTTGTNNGKPSIYSEISRNSLNDKEWTLNYNI